MSSRVADILERMAQNAGDAALRRGALIAGTVQQAGQIPAQYYAEQDRKRFEDLHAAQVQQQMGLEAARGTREAAQATRQSGLDARANTAQDAADLKEKALKGIIGAGFETDPATFDLPAAVSKAKELGAEDLIPTVMAVHEKLQPKLTPNVDPTKNVIGPTGNIVIPAVAAEPKLTYGQPFQAPVNGTPKWLRTGSDGKVYDLTGKMVEGSSVSVPPDVEKTPPNSYSLQPELDATGKQTGRFLGYNTKTNTWEPVKGQGPASTKAAPGAAAAATEAKTKTETLATLAQLDQAIEAAKDKIGPGSGRVSNVEQMIGNADPQIQALGVKMKAAKMQFDHAITGSVRAGASPLLIQQWDNILANKVTPDGLKAGVQAMRELISGGTAETGGVKILSITPKK